MPLRLATNSLLDAHAAVESERRAFAAKLRIARAVLGWSQTKLAERAGLTQRAVHKLEQGETEPRRMTVYSIEQIWLVRTETAAHIGLGQQRSMIQPHNLAGGDHCALGRCFFQEP